MSPPTYTPEYISLASISSASPIIDLGPQPQYTLHQHHFLSSSSASTATTLAEMPTSLSSGGSSTAVDSCCLPTNNMAPPLLKTPYTENQTQTSTTPSPFEIFQAWAESNYTDLSSCHWPSSGSASLPSSANTLHSSHLFFSPVDSGSQTYFPSFAELHGQHVSRRVSLPSSASADHRTRVIGAEVWNRLCGVFEHKYFMGGHVDDGDSHTISTAISSTSTSRQISATVRGGAATGIASQEFLTGRPNKHLSVGVLDLENGGTNATIKNDKSTGMPLPVVCDALLLGCKFDLAGCRNYLLDETLDKLYRQLYPINQFSSRTQEPLNSESLDFVLLLYQLCAIAVKTLYEKSTIDTQTPQSAQSLYSNGEQLHAFARSTSQLQCTIFSYSLLVLFWISKEDIISQSFLETGSIDTCSIKYLVEMYSSIFHKQPLETGSQPLFPGPIDVVPHLQRLVWVSLLYHKLCSSCNDKQVFYMQQAFALILEQEYKDACGSFSDKPLPCSSEKMVNLHFFDFDKSRNFQADGMCQLAGDFFQALALIYRAIFKYF